jgi:hypothetical protein
MMTFWKNSTKRAIFCPIYSSIAPNVNKLLSSIIQSFFKKLNGKGKKKVTSNKEAKNLSKLCSNQTSCNKRLQVL